MAEVFKLSNFLELKNSRIDYLCHYCILSKVFSSKARAKHLFYQHLDIYLGHSTKIPSLTIVFSLKSFHLNLERNCHSPLDILLHSTIANKFVRIPMYVRKHGREVLNWVSDENTIVSNWKINWTCLSRNSP